MRWVATLVLTAVLAVPVSSYIVAQIIDAPVPGVAFAEGEEAAADGGGKSRTFLDSVKAGGAVGHFIILLSVAALALIIQYSVEQKHDKMIPPHVVAELEQLFEEQAYDEAAELCQAEDCYMTRIVGAGLAKMEGGYDSIMKAVDAAGNEESTKMFAKLSNLTLLVGVGPMLGLYGTVTGMISAFNVIASTAGGASPAQLADGISEALVTTFEGLTVAIPTSVAYHFLKMRAIRITLESGNIASNLFDKLKQPAA